MTTQAAYAYSTPTAYTSTIKFPETEIFIQVTEANEIRRSKKGHYVYMIDRPIMVFSTSAMSGTDSMGRKHIDYSESIAYTDIIKEVNGELFARYKRSFYPMSCFVCSYVAQPCIYV